jgi:hypothetical protein
MAYAHEDKERGMAALIVSGSSAKASELTGIPASTLREWKKEHPERYEALRTELHGKVAEQIASDAEEMAQRLYRIEVKMADSSKPKSTASDAKDLAGAFRNVTTRAKRYRSTSSVSRLESARHVQQGRDLDQVVQPWRDSWDSTRRVQPLRSLPSVPLPSATDDPNVRASM